MITQRTVAHVRKFLIYYINLREKKFVPEIYVLLYTWLIEQGIGFARIGKEDLGQSI